MILRSLLRSYYNASPRHDSSSHQHYQTTPTREAKIARCGLTPLSEACGIQLPPWPALFVTRKVLEKVWVTFKKLRDYLIQRPWVMLGALLISRLSWYGKLSLWIGHSLRDSYKTNSRWSDTLPNIWLLQPLLTSRWETRALYVLLRKFEEFPRLRCLIFPY